MTRALLADRARILVTGAEAESFLQNLITTDLPGLEPGTAAPGALLTPQGKILFFFLIARIDGGFALETTLSERDALIKRLTLYRLRARVEIAADPVEGTTILFDEPAPEGAVLDRRFAKAGVVLARLAGAAEGAGDAAAYHALRIRHGMAETAEDFPAQEAYPHDILLDLSGGLSFRKGCYVGQEVVSRMQHRATARRRVTLVTAEAPLPPSGTEVIAGGKPAGALGSVDGTAALAILRLDRIADAVSAGKPVTAGGIDVIVALPGWSGLTFPADGGDAA